MKKISYYSLFFFLLLSSNLFSAEKQKELIKEHESVFGKNIEKKKCDKLECQVLKGMEGSNHEVHTFRKSKGKSHLNYERE